MRIEPVGAVDTLLARLRRQADGPVLLGVDAPIGLPHAYARRHASGHAGFLEFLAALSDDSAFFRVCDRLDEVSGARPFYPRTTAGSPRRHPHAVRLDLASPDALLRRCDAKTPHRARAACLFWTLGANQVGKAALSLWRELLLPACRADEALALWPFAGDLHELLSRAGSIVAEAYPAEALGRLRAGWCGSKRRQPDRKALAASLRNAIGALAVEPDAELDQAIGDGFGAQADAEDRFDGLLGLLGMLATLEQPDESAPRDDAVRRWEGWILGQRG